MSKDDLGDRIKQFEDAFRNYLPNHFPVIVRVDGKAFHSLTKNAEKPFDFDIEHLMDHAALELCRQVQNVQIAYIQSDEISLLLHPYKKQTSQAWFDNNIQKIVSVSAAIATAAFNKEAYERSRNNGGPGSINQKFGNKLPALFDSRAFIVPEYEVVNYFIWRQNDAKRNSISMLARSLYSHKELKGKNNKEMMEMTLQKGKDWNALKLKHQRGRCVRKISSTEDGENFRAKWTIDNEIPVFSQCRDFIQQFVGHKEDVNEE